MKVLDLLLSAHNSVVDGTRTGAEEAQGFLNQANKELTNRSIGITGSGSFAVLGNLGRTSNDAGHSTYRGAGL